MNYYEILGVAPNATKEEIDAARKKLIKKYHPDTHPEHIEEYTRKIAEINNAYETLGDMKKRADYDAELNRRAHAPNGAAGNGNSGNTAKPKAPRKKTAPGGVTGALHDLGLFH